MQPHCVLYNTCYKCSYPLGLASKVRAFRVHCKHFLTVGTVLISSHLQDRLVDEGYNPAYGARPLRRAIMRLLEDSMAERMLSGDIKGGDSVIIDVDADGQINVLNGDKKMTSSVSAQPAGIS